MPVAANNGIAQRITSHVPPGQFTRYLVVGAVNTAFGYGTFALFTALLQPVLAHGYIIALLLSSLLNITVAYLGYKWFVFKTKGNYLREWMRCIAVYSSGIALATAALPAVVYLLRHTTSLQSSAPYVAGAIVMGLNVVYNFLGHKKFSFAQAR